MDQQPDLPTIETRQLDPEAFRRVWARVMPDQTNSPIEATAPPFPPTLAPTASAFPMRSPVASALLVSPVKEPVTPALSSTSPISSPETQMGQPTAAGNLRRLIDLAQEGLAAGKLLSRRSGDRARVLSSLAADYHQALRRLSAAYFLETGRRYYPKRSLPVFSAVLAMALREQFLWERQFAQECRQTAETLEDPFLRDLCQELAQAAVLHSRILRQTLERM